MRESRRRSEDFQTDAFSMSLASFYTFLKGRKHSGKFESFMQICTQIFGMTQQSRNNNNTRGCYRISLCGI